MLRLEALTAAGESQAKRRGPTGEGKGGCYGQRASAEPCPCRAAQGWVRGSPAAPYSVRSSGSRSAECPSSKARSVNSREWYSPRLTGHERSAPLLTRHSLTLSRPHDTILSHKTTLSRKTGLRDGRGLLPKVGADSGGQKQEWHQQPPAPAAPRAAPSRARTEAVCSVPLHPTWCRQKKQSSRSGCPHPCALWPARPRLRHRSPGQCSTPPPPEGRGQHGTALKHGNLGSKGAPHSKQLHVLETALGTKYR